MTSGFSVNADEPVFLHFSPATDRHSFAAGNALPSVPFRAAVARAPVLRPAASRNATTGSNAAVARSSVHLLTQARHALAQRRVLRCAKPGIFRHSPKAALPTRPAFSSSLAWLSIRSATVFQLGHRPYSFTSLILLRPPVPDRQLCVCLRPSPSAAPGKRPLLSSSTSTPGSSRSASTALRSAGRFRRLVDAIKLP